MFEFLLVVVGAIGVAISIAAKFVFARRSNANSAETISEMHQRNNAELFGKPGRGNAEIKDTEP